MGADGHIYILKHTDVLEAFPDADELFTYFDTHYLDELDGVKYDHLYYGDNIYDSWDAYWPEYVKDDKLLKRLYEFQDWIEENNTHWEVWT